MLTNQRSKNKGEGRDSYYRCDPRLTVKPRDQRTTRGCKRSKAATHQDIDPEEGADLAFSNVRSLDYRVPGPQVHQYLCKARECRGHCDETIIFGRKEAR